MDITILAVGRLRSSYRAACDDYLKRVGRYTRIVEREVKEAGRAGSVLVRQREESRRLRATLPAGATLVALTREGSAWSSTELARQLERWRMAARPLVLLIGGSTGLGQELRQEATARWSLGPLTLPHELARVIACEQLYRAFTIIMGEPYHKEPREP
jgi:23S rRNA (pseudouridine1915-N3)-methyltransferase